VTLSDRLHQAWNDHDIDAFVACFATDYRSEQPAHPDRAFVGNEPVRANWSGIFADVPDLRAELLQLAVDGDVELGEWRIWGTRSDGSTMDLRGVVVIGVDDDLIAWSRLYLELVEQGAGITAAVDEIRGR
jgi:hypothetical protein